MDFSQFHFENNMWLMGVAAVPTILLLYALFYKGSAYAQQLERFADKHLLPHLLKDRRTERGSLRMPLLLWSLAWICGMIAMAGPRWNYTDVQAFKPEKDLVIVLDLSASMNAQDVKPSRLVQARERIEDLLNLNHGLTIGLVAYAAVPHMIAPLTDDTQTIRNLLPAIDTSLVTIQGDRLKSALEMAARMLAVEPGNSKSILIISDGNFEESSVDDLVKAADGATIYTMGVGTADGAPIADDSGGWLKSQDGKMLVSRLQTDRMQTLSAAGHGLYVEESFADNGIKSILSRINGTGEGEQEAHKNVRIWQERFYIPALVLALLLLPLFRKRYVFPAIVFLMLPLSATRAEAASWTDLFLNKDQQGQKAYDQGDYKGAMEKFSTPYQHGVAAYKAGQYDQAVQSFKAANNPQAEYNLGNAQLMQGNPEEAIASYESVLKRNPQDANAKHNLDIAKKVLEQQKQQPQQKQQNESSNEKKDDQQNKQQNQSAQSDKKEGENGQPQQSKGQEKEEPQKQANGAQDKKQDGPSQGSPQQGQKQEAQSESRKSESAETGQDQKQETHQGKEQQQAGQEQKNSIENAQKAQAQNLKEQKNKAQKQEEGSAVTQKEEEQEAVTADNYPRTQQDINADQWLDRIQNDPGSFLKNQFMIEDRESGLQ